MLKPLKSGDFDLSIKELSGKSKIILDPELQELSEKDLAQTLKKLSDA